MNIFFLLGLKEGTIQDLILEYVKDKAIIVNHIGNRLYSEI